MSLLVALLLGALALPAAAAPVCAPAGEGLPAIPEAACGGRIFAEAIGSATFIQHDNGEYARGIQALAAGFPNFVHVNTLANLLGDPTATSQGGRPIWVIEVTDFSVTSPKIPVAVSLSVHGNERAGLEGGVRYAEDLARWATSDPSHDLCNGTLPDSHCNDVSEVLSKVHLYLADINPDGWSKGDLANGASFSRTNSRGTDLNREFPTKGWTKKSYTPVSENESRAWVSFIEQVKPRLTADLHGELTSVNNAFADMMLPAGQWDPLEQARHESLANHMESNVDRYFELNNVVLGTVAGAANMRPAAYATGYDVVGYDDSGFMGDWFDEQIGAIDIDVEHFLSHTVPNAFWLPPLEQAHIAAVRGEIETLLVEALSFQDIQVSLELGKVGYLFDPSLTTDADGYGGPTPPDGVVPQSYSATRMKYFEDLSQFTSQPLSAINPGDISAGALADLDSFVISDVVFPEDRLGREYDHAAMVSALKTWVEQGGNLVLTDGALQVLADLGISGIDASKVTLAKYNAGHIDIDDFDHPFTQGLPDTASQTYYEVPLGFSVQSTGTKESPHWTVDKAAWQAAGGTHVAHSTATTGTALGEIALGQGTVRIIGALLPRASEGFDHFFGLSDYGVTVTGGTILNHMLETATTSVVNAL
ncbi:MAG: hypothetical protein QOG04_1648 [Actinomycetota bacterium]|jgi:hypothetical protein|nr:hypothetical protein [Actinomycetota bacterium]